MTWFRVGGAGIPASLKNNMNSVLNKKFGTTGQNYPPNGWPADVNLLGPLPEKTVAGAIAHTDDAADTVPVKSVICSIVPKQAGTGTPSPTNPRALSGSTGMTIFQHGKNFIDYIEQGGIDAQNGSELSSNTRVRTGFIRVNPSTQYTAAVNSENTNLVIYHVIEYSSNDTSSFITGTGKNTSSATFTTSANTNYIRLTARDVTSINITPSDLSKWQLETGSTATSFEAYNAAADISDSWSSIGEIYYANRNLTDGTLQKNGEFLQFDGSDDETWVISISGGIYRFYTTLSDAKVNSSGRTALISCNCGVYSSSQNTVGTVFLSNAKQLFYVPEQTITTVSDFKLWLASKNMQIVYEIETPINYTNLNSYDFETLYAVNNFYSDIEGGQTQVTYRQDIALALQAVSSSRGLMMASRPVTQLVGEESDPDQVNELVENDETEQEGEDNAR